MVDRTKTFAYRIMLWCAKFYWRLFRSRIRASRIMVVAQGRILLVRHRGNSRYNLPGGGIGSDEDPKMGALRELYEETTIALNGADYLLGTYTNTIAGKSDTVWVWVKEINEPLPISCAFELSDAGWFSLDQMPDITPATRLRICEYQAGSRNLASSWIS